MSAFFSDHYDALRNYSDRLGKFSPSNESEAHAAELVRVALKAVTFNREEYDALTPYTTARHGKGLLEVLKEPIDLQTLERASLFLASFVREASLVRESRSDSEQVVLDHYLGKYNEGDEWAGYHEDYLRYVLPNKLFESIYKSIGQARADSEELIQATEARANELESRIEGYRAELKKLESEYNFVGLSHAFNGLLREKRREGLWSLVVLSFIAALAIAVPVSFLLSEVTFFGRVFSSGWSPSSVASLLAAIGLEIVVLYFLRIVLKTYLLTRTQVTNLQLRVALCTFIEGYLEFATKAQAAKSSAAIQGFEALTFSSLPAGDSTLPPTLEGIEQLIKLIQAARGTQSA